MILDHAAHPRHYGTLKDSKEQLELHNPTCGDILKLEVILKDNWIDEIAFSGSGCTISQASASIMTVEVLHKTPVQVEKMVTAFSELVTGEKTTGVQELLGDAMIFEGIAQFPARIKCATLAWKAIYQILQKAGRLE
ncbi:hypothetical protein FD46_GL001297 [Liquorilactobacillus oeni DSM 19972]|uniref:NIF system FeS cluster assembly NifU N-terminal domain-containing protein n=1 Tax=Liquorilactobacillus oeni DSM 19972 TaxID=1423777 RepID=A0A0R1MG93_9LACO|nr:hypothetical protein FD46_GL001297 [Liquorilactobacillus oeni DSM 19972]